MNEVLSPSGRRAWRILAVLGLLALPLTVLITRDAPAIAQEQTVEPGTLTSVWATVTADAALFTPNPNFGPEGTAEPTIGPTATPTMTPTPIINDDAQLVVRARADLELLADSQLGVGVRPEGWSGITDPYASELALLTRLDLETLYSTLVSIDQRPESWIGAVGSTPIAIARDIRHDLELMANLFFGPTDRPAGWYGGDPLFRCNRATQVLVQLLQRGGLFTVETNPNDPNFCHLVEIAATSYTEQEILANTERGIFSPELALISDQRIKTTYAIAFLDSSARIRVGVVPNNTPIRVIGRSYADFSNMMLVSGPDFQVFVEYTNTTVTAAQFRALPNVATLEIAPTCFAAWCETAD